MSKSDVIFNREDICDDAVERLIVKELTESVEVLSEELKSLLDKPSPINDVDIVTAHYWNDVNIDESRCLQNLIQSINETIAYFSVPGEYHNGLYDIGGKNYGG